VRPSRRTALLSCATALFATVGVAFTSSPALAAGAVFGNGAPGFVVSASDAKVPLTPVLEAPADVAGEPSIGINWNTGAGLFMAGAATQKVTFDPATSHVTWADASPFFGTVQNLDPILATDPTTGTTIAGGDTGSCSVMFRSTDDGASWLPTVPCPLTTDHPSVGWAPSALTPGSRVWYYCQQQSLQSCATSTDDGVTWVPGSTDVFLDCEHYHGHIRGSADGTTYLPSHTCFDANGNIRVGGLRTTDDGASWSSYTIPTALEPASGFDPAVATTPDNTLYEGWNNAGDHHPVIAISHDHGTTWGGTHDLASSVSPPLVAATFPTLVAGDNGRVAYSYLGTSAGDPAADPFSTGFHGVWYLYTSYTYDGGATWTTVKDTATPVQYGEIDSGGTTTAGQRNLLDFMDSSLTKDGRVVVAFADGCLSDCEAAGATSQSSAEALSTHAWATVAYQNAGRGLFSQYDVVLPAGAPTLTATGSSSGVNLGWTVPSSDGGGAITGYNVYRDGTLLTTATGLSVLDSSAVKGTAYTYTVKAVNSAGPGAASNAASAAAYTVPGAPTLTVTASGQDARLTWSAPDNGGSAITGYQVLRGTSSGAEVLLSTTSATSLTDTGLAAGQTYFYEVTATNAAGTGAPSAEQAFANATAPAASTLSAAAGKGQVQLSWTAPANGGSPITGYCIYRGLAPGTETLVQTISTGTTYVDAGLSGGTTYWYRVAAVNAAGVGALSNEVSAAPKRG
jgi:hypothetical protein